ncbi:MAG: Sua5/YciO/YrdC/YwlC family protein [Chitinophagales bacterium]|nr:Sua5/YciO/YrdC/YwlC family protein [Chitinophagales bacterium]
MFLLRDDISEITALLERGAVICFPTDTVWAIGCNVFDEAAIQRISDLKGGRPDKGYVLLVSSIEMLKRYVPKLHPRIETLLSFHERPLSIVYDKNEGLPASVKAPDGSVAIRVVQDEFCRQLIESLGRPMLGTVAARTDAPFPPTFGAVSSEILGGVDYVVKHRQDDKEPAEPSPIAKLDRHLELDFLRE